MSGLTWRGDDGDPPRRTRRLLRWYRRRVAQWFEEGQEKNPIDAALCAGLVEWFGARPAFLRWRAWDKYQGARYASGYWELDFAAMKPALKVAIQEVEDEQRRQAYEALGPITGDDVDRALALLEGQAPLTQEPYAGNLYADGNGPAAMRWYENRGRIHAHWPRDCRACQQEFKPDFNGAVRCPECRTKARLERAQPRGQEEGRQAKQIQP